MAGRAKFMGMLLAFVFAKQSTSTLHISKAKQITECSHLKISLYELKKKTFSILKIFLHFCDNSGESQAH